MPIVVNVHGPDPLDAPPPIVPPVVPPTIAAPPSQTPDLPRAQERFLTVNGAGGVVPIIYGGPLRVGGYIVFAKELSGFLYLDFVVCEGPVESISAIKIDGRAVADIPGVAHNVHLGVAADTTDGLMTTADAGYASPEFVAHVAFRFPTPDAATGSFNPIRFECEVEGRLLYDPRDAWTAFSTNPALMIYDLITNTRYGFSADAGDVDDASFEQAADDCDVDIDPGAGTVKRWEASIRLDREMGGDEALNILKAHCGGILVPSPKWKLALDVARASTDVVLIDNGEGRNCQRPIVDTKDVSEIPTVVIIEWTDAENGYRDQVVQYPDPLPANTEWREARYSLRGFTTIERSRRMAIYLYNRLRLDKRISTKAWEIGLRLEPGDRFTLNSRRLGDGGGGAPLSEDCTVSECRASSLGWTVYAELYRLATFSDDIDTTGGAPDPTPPQTPYSVPPNPTGVSVVEQVSTGSDGQPISRLKLSWTNAATPFYRGTRVTYSTALEPLVMMGEHANGPIYLENPTLGVLYTFTLKTISTGGIASTGVSVAITPDMFPDFVPAPGRAYDVGDGTTYWDAPPNLIASGLYVTGFWTNSNFPSYDGTRVNDGLSALAAFTLNTALEATLTFDAGVGETKEFRGFRLSAATPFHSSESLQVRYSDDGVGWTNVPSSGAVINDRGLTTDSLHFVEQWDDTVGAHRYWQYWRTSGNAQSTSIVEVQFYELTTPADFPYVSHYEIRDVGQVAFPGVLVKTIPVALRPTVSTPLELLSAITPQNNSMSVHVYAVDVAGNRSAAFFTQLTAQALADAAHLRMQAVAGALTAQPGGVAADRVVPTIIQTPPSGLALSNGDNDDVALGGFSTQRITGPTAAYAITGLEAASAKDGDVVMFWNTVAQTLTLKHEDAGSAAANRIVCPGGADMDFAADAMGMLQYDATTDRWRVLEKGGAGGGGSNHDLLSATHTDTVADAVAEGDLLVGNATPEWERLAKGTEDQVFTMLDADTPGWADPSGGDPSEIILESAYASRPAAGTEGRVSVYTDAAPEAPVMERDNGTSWTPYYPTIRLVPPDNSIFSDHNLGTSSVVTTKYGIRIITPSEIGNQIRGREVAIPSTPYNVYAVWQLAPDQVNTSSFPQCGIFLRASAGRLVVLATFYNSGNPWRVSRWTSNTALSADQYLGNGNMGHAFPWGMTVGRMLDDGTNIKFFLRRLGMTNWMEVYSEGRTAFLTGGPVTWGIYASSGANAANKAEVHFLEARVV